MAVAVAATALGGCREANAGPGRWRSRPALPVALAEVASGVVGGRLYVVGGGRSATLAFDRKARTWTDPGQLARRPFLGDHHAAEVVRGRLFLFGGLGGSEGRVQVYDPSADRWQVRPSMPFAAGSSATAVLDDQVYVAGGIVGSSTIRQAARYDPAARTWSALPRMPKARNHAASIACDGRFWVIGGRGPGSGGMNEVANGFASVQVFDPATGRWDSSTRRGSALRRLPQARGGMGKAVCLDGEVWVLGGETATGEGANPGGVYDRVDVYDIAANRWRSGPPLPTARHGVFPVLAGGRIHVAGGGVQAGASASTAYEVLRP